jgi:Amt family ammonium transporter
MMKKLLASLALGLGLMLGGTAAMAQTAAAPAAAPVAEAKAEAAAPAEAAPILCSEKCNKGDTAWMTVATVLVILMTIPGLALFYGGLVRTKTCCLY